MIQRSLRYISFLVLVMTPLLWGAPAGAVSSELQDGLSQLTQKNFNTKITGLEMIVSSAAPQTERILNALMDSALYYLKHDKTVVFLTQEAGDGQCHIEPVTDAAGTTIVDKRALSKIGINNQIRKKIKGWISQLQLSHPDPDNREKAVYSMLSSLDAELIEMLTRQLAIEKDSHVRSAITTALALNTLESGTIEEKLAALPALKAKLYPSVKNRLMQLYGNETDHTLKQAVAGILQGIERRITFYRFIETVFFGLSAGSILVLAAIGLAITFGVIGVINMAHGELIMIGAYTTYVIQQLMPQAVGMSIVLAVPAAFIVSGLTGILIERSIIRFLYGRPLETLLATFGVSLVLQQAVRTIFSPLNRMVSTPEWMSGSLYLNPVLSLTMNRIVVLIFCLMVFGALFLIMKKTSLGLQVRAVSQNRPMARAMGVRAARVDALTFGLGSGIAGVAGVALSQLTNVGPNLGQSYIIDSFMVVVFGGVGNLWGALLAGLSLGTANKFIEPFSGAVLAKIIVLVFIILFIQKRPQGLFPQKGRAAG